MEEYKKSMNDAASLVEEVWEMDQNRLDFPESELLQGKPVDIRAKALEKINEYLKDNPSTPEINRAIFMLYHHGAGIDKELAIETYKNFLSGNTKPSVEYSNAYLESEEKGKKYLDAYVQESNKDDFAVIQDQANWYRRVAYFAKYAGREDMREENLKKAIELHKKLLKTDKSIETVLQEIYEEQI